MAAIARMARSCNSSFRYPVDTRETASRAAPWVPPECGDEQLTSRVGNVAGLVEYWPGRLLLLFRIFYLISNTVYKAYKIIKYDIKQCIKCIILLIN